MVGVGGQERAKNSCVGTVFSLKRAALVQPGRKTIYRYGRYFNLAVLWRSAKPSYPPVHRPPVPHNVPLQLFTMRVSPYLMLLDDVARLEHPRGDLRHTSPHGRQA